jgi:hypothetical protein
MLKRVIFFPFMVAVYPVLALLADNLGQIGLGDGLRPTLLVLVAASVVFLLARLIYRNWRKAALATFLIFILFFSYGKIYRGLEGTTLAGINLGRHRVFIPVYALVLFIGLMAVGRLKKVDDVWVVLLNTVSATMVLLTVMHIGSYQWESWQTSQQVLAAIPNPADRFGNYDTDELPDIYYIVLDEYGRRDVLNAIYGYDNLEFEQYLIQHGFQVMGESRTNYAQTELVFSANLNLDYLQSLNGDLDPDDPDRAVLWGWIQHSQVQRALEDAGYRTVAFATGFQWSQLESADDYRQPPLSLADRLRTAGVTNAFEGVLMQNSAGIILIDALQKVQADLEYPYRMHRLRILYVLDQLTEEIPALPGPKFVFAHLIAPHGPPVLGPNGEAEVSEDLDQAYRDEITYLNQRLKEVIAAILSGSEREVIIIVQADTGPAVHLDWDSPDAETLWARMTNFNAIYLPERYQYHIPEDISSVNTFRVIFNQVFDADYPLLDDRSYFTNWDRPYDFVDVTDEVLSYP